jgi:hypothetical protein
MKRLAQLLGIMPPTPDEVRARLLAQARLDIIEAEQSAEAWTSRVLLLRNRIRRLETSAPTSFSRELTP